MCVTSEIYQRSVIRLERDNKPHILQLMTFFLLARIRKVSYIFLRSTWCRLLLGTDLCVSKRHYVYYQFT